MAKKDTKILWVTSDPHNDTYSIDNHLVREGIELDYCPWVEQAQRRLSTGDYTLILINGDGLTPPSKTGDPFRAAFDRTNLGDRSNYTGRPAVSLELVKKVSESFPEITILTYGIDKLTISVKELKKAGSKEHLIVGGGDAQELADKIFAYFKQS